MGVTESYNMRERNKYGKPDECNCLADWQITEQIKNRTRFTRMTDRLTDFGDRLAKQLLCPETVKESCEVWVIYFDVSRIDPTRKFLRPRLDLISTHGNNPRFCTPCAPRAEVRSYFEKLSDK